MTMKYQQGQLVILLDTEFKPVVNAIVKDYNAENEKYLIEFSFPSNTASQEIWVPQERLLPEFTEADK
jgi:hypothetical protein